jgi:hypothetical protein
MSPHTIALLGLCLVTVSALVVRCVLVLNGHPMSALSDAVLTSLIAGIIVLAGVGRATNGG